MARRSLRLRLLIVGLASIVVALVLAGAFIFSSFSVSMEATRRDDLQASLDRLTAAIDPDTREPTGPEPLSDPRYDSPLSGLYWQVDDLDTGAVVRSRSLWDQELPLAAPAAGTPELRDIAGPDNTPLIVLTRHLEVMGAAGQRHFNVAVAEARSQDDDPIQRFGISLLVALLILGVVLALAAAAQVHFGLQPLRTLRKQIADIRHGETAHLPEGGAEELEPVVTQINELLDAQEASIAFARQRAADLAHGLKTPLAILSATSERLRLADNRADADLLEMLTEQMNGRIDYQLRIARLRYRTRAQGTSAALNETVLRSVAVLRKAPDGERVSWRVDLPEALDVDIDEHDLMELCGIVLENAAKWARSQVVVGGQPRDDVVELRVEDDGVGVSDELLSRLGQRGLRLDESMPGDGIGLAIAFEIVRLNRGTIVVDRSDLGGLRLTIRLPQSQHRTVAAAALSG
jgi:signal transduction histidine kinase